MLPSKLRILDPQRPAAEASCSLGGPPGAEQDGNGNHPARTGSLGSTTSVCIGHRPCPLTAARPPLLGRQPRKGRLSRDGVAVRQLATSDNLIDDGAFYYGAASSRTEVVKHEWRCGVSRRIENPRPIASDPLELEHSPVPVHHPQVKSDRRDRRSTEPRQSGRSGLAAAGQPRQLRFCIGSPGALLFGRHRQAWRWCQFATNLGKLLS